MLWVDSSIFFQMIAKPKPKPKTKKFEHSSTVSAIEPKDTSYFCLPLDGTACQGEVYKIYKMFDEYVLKVLSFVTAF